MTQQEILKKVPWRDLREISKKEIIIENNLTLPWLFLSLLLAYHKHYFLALPFSGFFFLTGLRQVHNGFHNALGTNRFLTWLTLYLNSILMISSVHAIEFNHLRHHQHCLSPDDYEGKSATMTWYGAILYGPIHVFKIHEVTWKLGNKMYRRNMLLELFSISTFAALVFYFQIPWLIYHLAVMIFGELLMSFFAVWLVHHDTHENPDFARTQRVGWKNKLTFNMFYHLEHHLFPAVPTTKLPELAKRIDHFLPEINKKNTF